MTPLKILIVEDELIISDNIEEMLLDFGYAVTAKAANSTEAIAAFQHEQPDVVLCDIVLKNSVLDGIDLVGKLNEIQRVPIVFLTGNVDERTIQRANKVQAAYFLIKPTNEHQLKSAIQYALTNFSKNIVPKIEESTPNSVSPLQEIFTFDKVFFIKDGTRFVKLNLDAIFWVEADNNNVKVFTEAQMILLKMSLTAFMEQVPHPVLWQIHRSFLINAMNVHIFEASQVVFQRAGKSEGIPIGRSYKAEFDERLARLFRK